MAAFRDYKKMFLRELVQNGKIAGEYPSVPAYMKEKWLKKFLYSGAPRLQEQPRLLNRFMLGADPECIFVNTLPASSPRYDEEGNVVRREYRIDAAQVGLKTGLAFGADQNGRLIELRPRPDRFALKVLASIWSELKWMALLYPMTMQYQWQCGAYLFGDGIGGHIHFGRKRPTRTEEVRALDQVGRLLYSLNSFPRDQWNRRQEGDERGQRYGRFGDFRPQIHGYEYRTLPSWLDDPWLAYLCLVLTKLAIYNPKLVEGWGKSPEHIRHILAYYKGLDDDAAIALKALEVHGIPVHKGGDFKERWGIRFQEPAKGIEIIPGSIEPTSSEISELFDFLVQKTPLDAKQIEPTWSPTKVPEGFRTILDSTNIVRVAGMGEILTGLCDYRNLPIEFYPAEGNDIRISSGLISLLPKDWKEQLQKIAPMLKPSVQQNGNISIGIGDPWRNIRRIQLTKKILTSGIFPIWKVKNITKDTAGEWAERQKKQDAMKSAGMRTRILREPTVVQ